MIPAGKEGRQRPRGRRLKPFWLGILAVSAVCAHLVTGAVAAGQERPTIRMSINPLIYAHLPVMVAADKGYFAKEGLDVSIAKYKGSSNTQLPMVARGDLDLTPVVAGPALFNQKTQGFDLRVIAFEYASERGWNESVWLLVRKDLYESGAVRTIKDLRGRAVDGGPDGTPVNVLMRQALTKAGLGMNDVKFSTRLATPPDWLAALRNKAVDALTAVEPIASQIEKQGYGVKLVSPQDVASWSPTATIVANPEWLGKNRPAAVRFAKALLHADRDILAGGPHWTPELVNILSHWSQMRPQDISAIASPSYYGNYGAIDADHLTQEQDFWISVGLVKQRVDVKTLIDTSVIDEARKEMGIQ